jgi:hypothetical protein
MKKLIFISLILLIISPLVMPMETINISEMTIEEKVGQLLLVRPNELNEKYLTELHVSGIFLNKQRTKDEYKKYIDYYKNNSKIDLFIAADMEGYWNSFSKFYSSRAFGELCLMKQSILRWILLWSGIQ